MSKPHSPYEIKDNNLIKKWLRKMSYELKPNSGEYVTESYKDYYKKFKHKK